MIDDLISLKQKFENIKKKGWVESLRNGTTGIGYTFETLIGKEEESFPIPDYRTIEIKTRYKNSKENIGLLNVTPDGDYLYPLKRLYDAYGFPSKSDPNYKVFYAAMGVIPKYAGKQYRFKLFVDRKNNLIRVIAIDKIGNMINTDVSWSFKLLEEKLKLKLKYLAFIKAECHYEFGKQYFYYYDIKFYMLKSFKVFLELIEKNIIKTTFMIGSYKTGPKKGEMNSHGVRFDIAEEDLDKLFIFVC